MPAAFAATPAASRGCDPLPPTFGGFNNGKMSAMHAIVSPSVVTLSQLLWLMNEDLILDSREVEWGHDIAEIRARLALTRLGEPAHS
jgi:hypothetical protein